MSVGTPAAGDRPRRIAPRTVVVAVVMAVAFGVVASQQIRSGAAYRDAFPLENGRIAVAGVEAGVEIRRDDRGIPHVSASSEADAFFGLGFVHAQDRLAQMLWLRSLARGRSAEVVGAEGLPADRLARSLDFGGLGDREFARLDAATRGLVAAYAKGVTARIGRVRDGTATPPVAWDGDPAEIADWTGGDSIALFKLYSWGLSGGLDVSIVLNDLIERLGGFGARRFFPEGDRQRESRGRSGLSAGVSNERRAPVATAVPREPYRDPLRVAARLDGRGIGSSAWVVSGAQTDSGAPILAADHHLPPTAPSLVYVAHFRGGHADLAGSTIPGIPVVWSGHNARLAWASTNARAVTTDLYEEKLGLADAGLYYDGNTWRELSRRNEVIEVRDGEPEILEVRGTRHGPLVQDLIPGERRPLALAWTGARADATPGIASLLEIARAHDTRALRRAFARHEEPPLAFAYAADTGVAGVQVAGWVPQRALASGLAPLPGRARWYDWAGPVPFDALPQQRIGRHTRFVVAADNAFAPGSGAARVEWLWRSGVRATRIGVVLDAAMAEGKLDAREVAALQVDVGMDHARELIAMVLEFASIGEAPRPEASEIANLLRVWDGRSPRSNTGAAVYHVFLDRLTRRLLAPWMGETLMQRYLALPQTDPGQVVFGIVREATEEAPTDGPWRVSQVATAVRESLRETWFQLSYQLGPNRSRWQWGRLHRLRFSAFRPGGPLGAASAKLGPYESGGSNATIDTTAYDRAEPFGVTVASTFRMTIDTGALDEALTSLAPGQSEHPDHPHFADGVAGWRSGRPQLLPTSLLMVEESSRALLVLEPVP